MNNEIENIYRLVSEEKTEQALRELLILSRGYLDDDIRLQQAALKRLKKSQTNGIISFEKFNQKKNEINLAILRITNELKLEKLRPKEFIVKFKITNDIRPIDVLGVRGYEENNFRKDFYYYRSDVDDPLIESYLSNRNIVIQGKPYAGKSRALLELIKKQDNRQILILKEDQYSSGILEAIINHTSRTIVVFDDVDEFLLNPDWRNLFMKVSLDQNTQVISTIRLAKLQELHDFIEELKFNYDFIEIPSLSIEQKNELSLLLDKKLNETDDTIGSFLLDLEPMKLRFHNELSLIQKEILRSYKIVELWRGKNRGSKIIIEKYVKKRFRKYHKSKISHSPSDWDNEYAILVEKGFISNFSEKIKIQDTYLEQIIYPDLNEELITREILSYYSDVQTFTKLIGRVKGNNLRNRIFKLMREKGVKPDVVTYSILINKSVQFRDAKSILELMQAEGVKPDIITYTNLVKKSPKLSDAKDILALMQAEGVKPNSFTYNSLINKSALFSDAKDILALMQAEGVKPNSFTYNSLINKSSTFSDAKSILELMQSEGIKPDAITCNSLINKSATFSDAKSILELMQVEGIKPDAITHNSLINKSATFSDAKSILELMQSEGIKPDAITYNSLINKSATFSDAKEILELMQADGLKPDRITYTSLINKSTTFIDAKSILELMQAEGVKPDAIALKTIKKLKKNHG